MHKWTVNLDTTSRNYGAGAAMLVPPNPYFEELSPNLQGSTPMSAMTVRATDGKGKGAYTCYSVSS